MSPQVAAAVIAASVSFLTLVGTLAAQYFGRRATSRDTKKAFEEQGKQLDRTLAEQRTRTLNERFAAAAGQLVRNNLRVPWALPRLCRPRTWAFLLDLCEFSHLKRSRDF